MKFEDRIQALKMSSKYKKDYKKYDENRKKKGIDDVFLIDSITPLNRLSPEGQKLCKKYKIPYPFHPDANINGIHFVPSVLPIPIRIKKTGEQIFGLEDEQFLNVKIDINSKLKDIKKDIGNLYHFYSKQIKLGDRDGTIELPKGISIWDIFEMRHNQNKSILQITKEIFKIKESPSNDVISKSKIRTIERAVSKAKKLIQEAED